LAPLVSILIPTYNRASCLPRAIESGLSQSFQDIELVVSDNASTDDSWEIIQEYARKDGRIRAFKNPANLGPVPNWIKCLQYSRGQYIKYVFSDDWLEADAVYLLVERLNELSAEAALGGIRSHYPDGKIRNTPVSSSVTLLSIQHVLSAMLIAQPKFAPSPSGALFKRKHIAKAFAYQPITSEGKRRYKRGFGIDAVPLLLAASAGGIAVVRQCIWNAGIDGSNECLKDREPNELILEPWHTILGEYIEVNRELFADHACCLSFARFVRTRSIGDYYALLRCMPLPGDSLRSYLTANIRNLLALVRRRPK